MPLRLIFIALAMAAPAHGRTIAIHVDATRAPSCRTAILRATSAAGATVERMWSGGDVTLDLADGDWQIATSAGSCWAADVAATSDATVVLRPATTLRFRVAQPADVVAGLRISSPDGSIPPTPVDCTRNGQSYACKVPAMALDLRVGADGFVPHYLWSSTRSDLGDIRLTRGASVSGRLTIPDKKPNLAAIPVALRPASFGASPRDALATLTTHTNERGFFQFAGIDAGMYVVTAKRDGWSPARADGIRVANGAEVALEKPVAFTPLATLDVTIDPPADAGGKPWRVRLHSTAAENAAAPPIETPATLTGNWRAAGIAAGGYAVAVVDSAGTSIFHQEFLDIHDGIPPLHVTLDAVRVRGRVTFRGESLPARLTFTIPVNATAQIVTRTADDGTFSTILPEEGRWRVRINAAASQPHMPDVDVRRRADGEPVGLDLALPAGRIRGTTVDEDGTLIPATIRVIRNGHFADAVTAHDGRFDLIGVEPGDVQMQAFSTRADRDSGLVAGHASETDDAPMTIVLPKRAKAKAWIGTADGRPIAGALVRYLSANSVKEEVTGPSGELTLTVPSSETAVPIVIVAPGFGAKVMMLPRAEDNDLPEIILSPVAARFLFRNLAGTLPWIAHGGVSINGTFLRLPSDPGMRPRDFTSAGMQVDVEPGTYVLCPGGTPSERCRTYVLDAESVAIVDVKKEFSP